MSNENFRYSFNVNTKAIPFEKYEKNFTFIVNGEQYETSRFVADILSPIICKYHYEDETINEFFINTKSKDEQSSGTFQDFLSIINQDNVELNKEQRSQYGEYFLLLGNIKEYFRLTPLKVEDLTTDNIVDRLEIIHKLITFSEINEIENIRQIIDYASEHFFEIPKEKVKRLEVTLIEEIIKNQKLRLENEDSLFTFILELYEENHSNSYLFEYVHFKNLSQESLTNFTNRFSVEHINSGVFRSICNSITIENESKSSNGRYKPKFIEFKHKEGDEFNGIMKYLSLKTYGNIHDNGTIEITSNSIDDNSNPPKNVVDYTDKTSFRFNNNKSPNAEICFDFKDMQIQLTSYSIKSYNWSVNDDHLKSWIFEVSKDGKDWERIDEHSNDEHLNGPHYIGTFNTKETKSFYRFARLTQTGPCFSGDYHSSFVMFEFYGKLIIPN